MIYLMKTRERSGFDKNEITIANAWKEKLAELKL